MEAKVRAYFDRYERLFNRSLHGEIDLDAIAAQYASAYIAASPAGVQVGVNDAAFRRATTEVYARCRAIGTEGMRIRDVRVVPIDDLHCLASVAWTATYARPDGAVAIDFDVHYLVQLRDGEPKVFGWVSGDEEAVLRAHGIV